jgi:hypothetical protein
MFNLQYIRVISLISLFYVLLELSPLYIWFTFCKSYLPYMFNLHYARVVSHKCLIYILLELSSLYS